jgi:hypothetical protein
MVYQNLLIRPIKTLTGHVQKKRSFILDDFACFPRLCLILFVFQCLRIPVKVLF